MARSTARQKSKRKTQISFTLERIEMNRTLATNQVDRFELSAEKGRIKTGRERTLSLENREKRATKTQTISKENEIEVISEITEEKKKVELANFFVAVEIHFAFTGIDLFVCLHIIIIFE